MQRPIVAMGGGGLPAGGGRSPLDDLVLELAAGRASTAARRTRPRVCFIGTATGDDPGYIGRFHAALQDVADTAHLALFSRTVEDIPTFLLGMDAIYVGGGNTLSMLAVWRAHGVDVVLRQAHDQGIVLAGGSAGSICWFESGTTDSFGPTLHALHGGLGLIAGSHSPHYDGEPQRRPTYQALIRDGQLPPGIAVDDHAAALFDGPTLVEVVSARPCATAYTVTLDGAGSVVETALVARPLGSAP
jgi:dipeptidase E